MKSMKGRWMAFSVGLALLLGILFWVSKAYGDPHRDVPSIYDAADGSHCSVGSYHHCTQRFESVD